jgi:predicted transcriptional regulator
VPPKRSNTLTEAELRIKGYVEHRQEGRAFLYSACVPEHAASRSEVGHLLHRFFGNSREQLMISLLGDGQITPGELQNLKKAIAEAEAAARSSTEEA